MFDTYKVIPLHKNATYSLAQRLPLPPNEGGRRRLFLDAAALPALSPAPAVADVLVRHPLLAAAAAGAAGAGAAAAGAGAASALGRPSGTPCCEQ